MFEFSLKKTIIEHDLGVKPLQHQPEMSLHHYFVFREERDSDTIVKILNTAFRYHGNQAKNYNELP